MTATYDAASDQYTFPNFAVAYCTSIASGETFIFCYWYRGATITKFEDEVVTPPAGIEPETYAAVGTGYRYNNGWIAVDITRNVKVVLDGDDVYMTGLSYYNADQYLKGTFTDATTVVFPKGQFLGFGSGVPMWAASKDENGNYFVDIVATYSAEDKSFTFTNQIWECGTKNANSGGTYSYIDQGFVVSKVEDRAATPATPQIDNFGFYDGFNTIEFDVPGVDTEGNVLSYDKLAYQFYYEDNTGNVQPLVFEQSDYPELSEDMSVIPYTFEGLPMSQLGGIRLNTDCSTWKRVGIKSIYTGGGDTRQTETAWYDIPWPSVTTLPEGAVVSQHQIKGQLETNVVVNYEGIVNVATVGDAIYIQGLPTYSSEGHKPTPEGWIKGVKNSEGKYVFGIGQEVFPIARNHDSRYLLLGADDDFNIVEPVMAVDEENGVYVFETYVVINSSYIDRWYINTCFYPGLTISIDEISAGVSTVNAETSTTGNVIYNLQGQRVENARKGLFIINGKRVVVK